MARNGRIRLVGKYEAREHDAAVRELRDLERELRRQWRGRPEAENVSSQARELGEAETSQRL